MRNRSANLRRLYELGARYMTLTHTDSLSWADSATDEPISNGLTPFGEDVVREMNRLGMLVDLSHVSPDVMKQAIRISQAPVIFSHSSARGVADHPRNVPDDVLKRLPEKDGVVMVNFFSGFVVPEAAASTDAQLRPSRRRGATGGRTRRRRQGPGATRMRRSRPSAGRRQARNIPRGTIHVLLDHIDHIAKVAGVEHVGLGSDYDGVSVLPEQLDDVSYYPYITQGLLDRGYTEEQIRGILGENLMRVFRGAEVTAKRLQRRQVAGRRGRQFRVPRFLLMYDTDDTIVGHRHSRRRRCAGEWCGSAGRKQSRIVAQCFTPSDGRPISQNSPRSGNSRAVSNSSSQSSAQDITSFEIDCDLFLWPNERSYTRQPLAELHTLGSPPMFEAIARGSLPRRRTPGRAWRVHAAGVSGRPARPDPGRSRARRDRRPRQDRARRPRSPNWPAASPARSHATSRRPAAAPGRTRSRPRFCRRGHRVHLRGEICRPS